MITDWSVEPGVVNEYPEIGTDLLEPKVHPEFEWLLLYGVFQDGALPPGQRIEIELVPTVRIVGLRVRDHR